MRYYGYRQLSPLAYACSCVWAGVGVGLVGWVEKVRS
jgi:hypothetical protein